MIFASPALLGGMIIGQRNEVWENSTVPLGTFDYKLTSYTVQLTVHT